MSIYSERIMKNQTRRFARVLLLLLIVAFFAVAMVACSNGETPEAEQKPQEQIEVCNHVYGAWTVVTSPTCTKRGLRRATCSLCGDVKEEILNAVAHTPKVRIGQKPTCTENGYTDETYCSSCGEILHAAEILFAVGHSFENWQTITEPTCAENGVRRGTCSVCGQTVEEVVDALGHDLIHHNGQRATCTEPGYNSYDTCSRCDYTTYQETSVALGHIVVVDEAIDGCVENGWSEGSHCSRCGEVLVERRSVPGVGHSFDIVLNEGHEATCTSGGYSRQVQCSRCYHIEGGVTSPALGHDFDENEKCRRCGEWKEYPDIKMTLNGNEYIVEKYYDYIGGQEAFIPAKYHGLPVTEIGKEAFKGTNITNVQFSNVKVIGPGAFAYCANLQSLVVGEKVERISKGAFEFCQGLKTITLPDSLTIMGDYVFENCIALTSLTVPKNLTYLGAGLLFGCYGITELSVDEDNVKYFADGNCIIDSDSNTLIAGCKTSLIPNGVEVIGMGAFQYNRGLTSITIPNSVKVIGREAFSLCENLAEVSLGEGLKRIESAAFGGCDNVKSIVFPESLTYIGSIPSGLTSVSIPNGVRILNCGFGSEIENVSFSDNIESVSNYTFSGFSNLQYNIYDNAKYLGNTEHPYLVLVQAIGKDIETCEIADGCRIICKLAFAGCSQLTSVTIPNTVLQIGDDAFNGSKLEVVSIPSSLVDMSDLAFSFCGYIKSFAVDEDNPNYSSQDGIMYNKDKTAFVQIPGALEGSITIPESITSIEGFASLSNLTNVVLSNNLQFIGSQPFFQCPNLQYNEYDNATYLGSATNPYLVLMRAKDKNITSCVVHEDCKFIRGWAFTECSALESISVPDGIIQICDSAFSECPNLQYNEYDNAKYLGNETNPYVVLIEATSKDITSCMINENCKIIYDSAFQNCANLTSIAMPNGVVQICESAFRECTSLKGVTFGNGVVRIDMDAFYQCEELHSIVIPNSVLYLGSDAFAWTGLTAVDISDSVIICGAFYACQKMETLTIGSGILQVGGFDALQSLKTVTIKDGAEIINNLSGGAIEEVRIPSSVKKIVKIGSYAFGQYINIYFGGTKEQWFAIEKNDHWDETGGDNSYVVHCTDGDVAKI